MTNIDKFIEEKGAYTDKAYEKFKRVTLKVVSEDDLRELMKDKVLVDAGALADLKAEITVIACRKETKGDCKGAELLHAIVKALHPISSGDVNPTIREEGK